MPASDRVTGPAQILCQILLHLGCGLIRHRVEVRVEFRQEADAVAFDCRGRPSPACNPVRFRPQNATIQTPLESPDDSGFSPFPSARWNASGPIRQEPQNGLSRSATRKRMNAIEPAKATVMRACAENDSSPKIHIEPTTSPPLVNSKTHKLGGKRSRLQCKRWLRASLRSLNLAKASA